jgi:hypothetical protein
MAFAGSITLSADTIQRVFVEAAVKFIERWKQLRPSGR